MTEAWTEHGADCLRILAKEDPGKFAQLGLAILPRDILVSVEQTLPGGLDPADWGLLLRVLDLIKTVAPVDAAPGEVFGLIEQALKAHYAKRVEAAPSDPGPIDTGERSVRERMLDGTVREHSN